MVNILLIMVNINGYYMVNDGQWSSGWWYTSEKYESHLGWLFPIYGKEKCSKPPTSHLILAHFIARNIQKKSNTILLDGSLPFYALRAVTIGEALLSWSIRIKQSSHINPSMYISGRWFNHLENYEFVNEQNIPYMKWKIKTMFQTTKQIILM